MSNPSDQFTITVSRNELEALLRRIVREELNRLIEAQRPSLLDSWSHEGPDEPDGDAALLAEVLAQIEREAATPIPRIDWAAAKAELTRAEAAGELPD
ncbi:hypothetical protein EYB53_019095 [Candidatus Chloroploca sp. M-50]|uniref:Addiction module component n=1 Tax=Candidatus Chloroploca mongolica TaxID=2528176 RepID=A0ABS4DEG7_9CHLR|nr:hypothetical protein [Candidatus Chloroploca mongolica]MBP1467830.1 hypothetical protein [Candidatus Chloroploca mongolica]